MWNVFVDFIMLSFGDPLLSLFSMARKQYLFMWNLLPSCRWWTLPSVKKSAVLAHKHLANKHLANHQGRVCLPRRLQGVWERPCLRIRAQSKRKRGVRSWRRWSQRRFMATLSRTWWRTNCKSKESNHEQSLIESSRSLLDHLAYRYLLQLMLL